MGAPNEIAIFEEDFKKKDHIVTYGIGQDSCVRGLVFYIRKDKVLKILEDEKENTGIGLSEYDAGHENGRMELIESIINKIKIL